MCQHIFCLAHGPVLEDGQHRTNCPACKTPLDRSSNDFIEVDLQPSDRFKTLILAGQSPEIILDITRRAICFFEQQQFLRSQFMEYVASKSIEKTRALENQLRNIMLKMKEESSVYEHMKKALTQECEELRAKLIASDQKLCQLERECQKLRISSTTDLNRTTESQLLNRSFAKHDGANKKTWKPDLKRTRREVQPSPDSISDFSPMRTGIRMNQGENFNQSFRPNRGSPFRFVPVNSINPDSKNANNLHPFQFNFGGDQFQSRKSLMPNFVGPLSR